MPKVFINGEYMDVPADALFADDGTTPLSASLSQQAVQGRVFTEEDVARIRQEEKDKLYTQMERNNEELRSLRDQVGSLTAAEQRREAQLVEEQQRLEAEARAKEEQELDAKSLVQKKDQEWNERLKSMQDEWNQKLEAEAEARRTAEALVAREREYNDLKEYAQAQVAAHQEKIAPELLPWIQGNSKEEIDAAIARAVETTDKILAGIQQDLGQFQQQDQFQQPFQAPQPPVVPGTRVTGPAGMDPAAGSQTLTAEQIAQMPMDQYAKLRSQVGIGGQGNNRGLFG